MQKTPYFLTISALVSIFSFSLPEVQAQNRLFGTYYGGEGFDRGGKAATDAAGNVYVAGSTDSKQDVALNGFDNALEEPAGAYAAKFDANGKPLWATYYADGSSSQGADIGVDAYGNVFVLGTTYCPSLALATPGAHDSTCEGTAEIFLVKFDPQGKRLWGTYFGGSNDDYGTALSVSPSGTVYLTGSTKSPGIASGPDVSLGGGSDAIVAKFSPEGKLRWARYYGGSGNDIGSDIACKSPVPGAHEICYVTGSTFSSTEIAKAAAWDSVYAVGNSDAFLAQFSGDNGILNWGNYYGGTGRDNGLGVVVDNNLYAYIGGITFSSNSIASGNGFDVTYTDDGKTDLFLAKFTPSGARLVGTYYGSAKQELFHDLAIDTSGFVYVLGSVETEAGLPTPGAYDTTFNGQYDVIMAKFNPALMRLRATYYGGQQFEMGGDSSGGLAITPSNQIYLYGSSGSNDNDSIATPGAFKNMPEGTDSFLVKFGPWL